MSTTYCGCDPEANWVCRTHQDLAQDVEQKIREAFMAGYQCVYIRAEGRYIFGNEFCPGDPEGAYQAWRKSM